MPAETHVEQGPIDREFVLNLVRDRLADILETEPTAINEGDSFADDLDADSLALIEFGRGPRRGTGRAQCWLPHRRRRPRRSQDRPRRR